MSIFLSVCLSVCLYSDSENRPDITTYDPTGHLTKDLDISLAYPHSCDNVQSAAKISGYAAELREKRKIWSTAVSSRI